MNRKIKTLVALLLAAAMAFSLAGCGDKSNGDGQKETPTNTAAPEYVYAADYTKIDNPNNQWIGGNGLFTDEGFYYSTQEVVGQNIPEGVTPQWENQYAIWETVMYFVDYSGKVTKLANFKPLEKNTDHEYSSYISSMQATSSGDIMLFEVVNEYWSDAPEGTEMYSDLWYQEYRSASEYYIRLVEPKTGEIKKSFMLLIPEEIASPTDGSYFWPYGLVADGEGNYVLASESKVLGFDADGNMTACFDMDEYTEGVEALADGRAAVITWGNNGGTTANVVDLKSGGFSEKIELPSNAYGAISGKGDYDFYYNSGINFFGYDSKTKESKLLFNWINCDVNNDTLNGFGVLSDGTVVGVTNVWDKNYENCTSEIVKISSVPASSLPRKQTITLATQYLDYNLRDVIIRFNRSSDSCRIEVTDYSAFNTDEDSSAGLTKLNTEILAGNVPDIIDLNGLPYDRYAAKGILEDLYPFIDSDKELSRDDFFPNILQAIEQDGKLCATCSSFSLSTVMGASSIVGDTPGWTYDQLWEAYANMPEDCQIFEYYYTRYDALRQGLSLDIDSFCDWSTGTCSFDSDSFKDLLKFAAFFPKEFDWNNFEYGKDVEPYTLVSQGREMLMNVYLYNLNDAGMYDAMFGELGATYIGFPSDNGTGNMISANSGFAMSTTCADKEGAWQFLRTFFTEKYQTGLSYGIPTNLKAYRTMEKEAMTPQYRMTTESDANGQVITKFELDENGEKIKEPRGSYYLASGDRIDYYELSQEQADRIYELISTTTKFSSGDDSIYDIVVEQAEAFFQGQKSVDDVARLIQSKVNIYINEQR